MIQACKEPDSHHHDLPGRDAIWEECKHVSTTDSKIKLIDLRPPEPVQRPHSVSIGKNDLVRLTWCQEKQFPVEILQVMKKK